MATPIVIPENTPRRPRDALRFMRLLPRRLRNRMGKLLNRSSRRSASASASAICVSKSRWAWLNSDAIPASPPASCPSLRPAASSLPCAIWPGSPWSSPKTSNYFFEPEPQTLFRVHRGKDRLRLPQTRSPRPVLLLREPWLPGARPAARPLLRRIPSRQAGPFAAFPPALWMRVPLPAVGIAHHRHGAASYQVEQGDAIYFDANTTHSYECSGPTPATALIVTLQQPAPAANGTRPSQTTAQIKNPHAPAASAFLPQSAKPGAVNRMV